MSELILKWNPLLVRLNNKLTLARAFEMISDIEMFDTNNPVISEILTHSNFTKLIFPVIVKIFSFNDKLIRNLSLNENISKIYKEFFDFYHQNEFDCDNENELMNKFCLEFK
jgi:hypothetical protein